MKKLKSFKQVVGTSETRKAAQTERLAKHLKLMFLKALKASTATRDIADAKDTATKTLN
jgi:hypothetical protein